MAGTWRGEGRLRAAEEQGATFVELFFDLVFVFAVTQVAAVLGGDLTGPGVAKAAIVFWLVWWAWTQFTWSLNDADTEHVAVRLLTLVSTALAFLMAVTVPLVAGSWGWLFPSSYLVLRVIGIGLQWALASGDAGWTHAVRSWTLTSSLGLLAVASAVFVPPGARVPALGLAALLDVVAALRAGRNEWRIHTGHFAERHGLFVIIALGESLIAAGAGAADRPLAGGVLAVMAIAVVAACGLWWAYFGWVKQALEEGLAARPLAVMGRYARDVYSFAHFPLVFGVIGFAVGVEEAVAHPGDAMPPAGVVALVAGVVLILGGAGLALLLSGNRVPLQRLAAVAVLAVAGPPLTRVPAWAALSFVAVVSVLLAVTERGSPGYLGGRVSA